MLVMPTMHLLRGVNLERLDRLAAAQAWFSTEKIASAMPAIGNATSA